MHTIQRDAVQVCHNMHANFPIQLAVEAKLGQESDLFLCCRRMLAKPLGPDECFAPDHVLSITIRPQLGI